MTMQMHWRFLLCLALTLPAGAQTGNQWSLASILGFEYGLPGAVPTGWNYSNMDGTVVTDCTVAHSGNCSARLDRSHSSSGTSCVTAWYPIGSSGQTIQWTAWIKTENVNGSAAIYFYEDDASYNGLAGTQGQAVGGTTGWTQYSAEAPLNSQATQLFLGACVEGTGTAWVDDMQLLVDGQPVASVPAGFTGDHQFDNGSGITITSLSDIQVQNLAVLAKVWGFLKYYHPAVTGGQHQWDYDLFRAIPAVLAAGDGPTANQAIADWITARLGSTVAPCNPCATLYTGDLYMNINLDWLSDVSLLGSNLSQTLESIYTNRTSADQTVFVSLDPRASNPAFQFESYYLSLNLPDSGYQLLGLFRAWNMVQYFYPNRDVIANDPASSPNYWDGVLQQSIPGIATAQSSLAYQQQLLHFKAMINDTHSGISNLGGRPPIGPCQLPVQVRFVQGSPLVVGYLSADGANSGLQVGDVIQQLDGNAITDLVTQWTPYYTDSNQAARLRDIGNAMTQGACGAAPVSILRGQQQLSLTPDRVPTSTLNLSSNWEDDLPGNAFQMLRGNIAYLKLSSVVAAQSANYIESAAGTKGLIIDIRNYPSDFVVFTLGDLLASEPVNFVQFTAGDVTTPGAFHWLSPPKGLTPAQPHYPGKVVVLVDEITQSNAEFTAMAFRAAGAIVVGSTTAGADGNISIVPLPGGFYFYFSGIGVFYPDHTPTQRVGIVPDIVVTPTIAGIRAGRDEVLDAAVRVIDRRIARKPIVRSGQQH